MTYRYLIILYNINLLFILPIEKTISLRHFFLNSIFLDYRNELIFYRKIKKI